MLPYDAERDLRILAAMVDQLKPYLISDKLFWPISGRVTGGMPRLTVGGLLMRRARLNAMRDHLPEARQAALDKHLAAFEATVSEWGIHYVQKLAREWDMRVHLLVEFLKECEREENASACLDNWPDQARQRVYLHFDAEALTAHDALTSEQRAELAKIDRGLRRFLTGGEGNRFLWMEALQPAYPRETFWWLYVAPAAPPDVEYE